MSDRTMSLLRVDKPSIRFGGVIALDEPSFSVDRGEICGLIGPNGAGKTTLLNCISGLYRPQSGTIVFDGQNLSHLQPHQVVACGVGRTFQTPTVVPTLSVRDNVLIGNHTRMHSTPITAALRFPSALREEWLSGKAADALLEELGLAHVAHEPVKGMAFDLIRRIELARALIALPSLLLLDEPASGLAEAETVALSELLRHLREERRIAIVLIEHHMRMLMSVSDNVVVMHLGKTIAQGTPDEVRANPLVVEAYLGVAS